MSIALSGPSVVHSFPPLEADKDTGLPILPDGMAWKVSRTMLPDKVKIELVVKMESPEYRGKQLVRTNVTWLRFGGEQSTFYEITAPTSKNLGDCAKYIYNDVLKSQEDHANVEALVGLYPPNSL